MRRYCIVAAAAVTAFGLINPLANATPVPTGPAANRQLPANQQATETDALEQARQTGQPVEITDKTTETTRVLAKPDGTFIMSSNVRAVRVHQNGAWRAIDTTLVRNPDGSLSPAATAQNVTFSGGGDAPMVILRHDDKTLAFSWPTALPAPTIVGDTAVYPAVLPGIDLQITARSDSYSQVLIVHDATAAANPALAHVRLTAVGTGLNLIVRPDGSLSAADPDGVEVFHGPVPLMWDSHHDDPAAPVPTATDPGGGHVTPLAVTGEQRTPARDATSTSMTDLTIIPDPAALTGPDVVYPLFLDPSMSVRKQHWTRVTDNGWPQHWDDPNAIAQVGYCGGWPECGGFWRARSFFQLDTTPLQPRNGTFARIWRAQFFATQVWSADHNCNGGQPTDVWQSDTITAGTNWPGPISIRLDTQHSNAGGPCPANNLVFNVMQGAGNAAGGGWPYLTLGLLAPNENDRMQWKKFDNNPLLEIDFSFPPNNATGLRISNEVRCHGKSVTPDAHPTLYATATDNNNPPLRLGLWHHVWTADDSYVIPRSSGIRISSGTVGQWQVPDYMTEGDWKFRVFTHNDAPEGDHHDLSNPANGGFSAWYPFTVRPVPPSVAPVIGNSIDYPANYWGAPSGAPGAIPVDTDSAFTNVVGFTYTFAGSGTEIVPNTTDCNYNRTFGTSGGWIPNSQFVDWIPIPTGLSAGYHTVHVRGFDDAHNLSPESSHTFYVAPHTGLSTQRFEAEALPRSQPAGQNVTLGPQTDCCGVTWSGGAHLFFRGNGSGQSFTLTFDTSIEADYQIALGMTRANDYGGLSFRIDGQLVGEPPPPPPLTSGSFDGYNPTVIRVHHPLGLRHLTRGQHTLTITTVFYNGATRPPHWQAGIDYISLTQTTRYEAEQPAQVTPSQPPGQNVSLGTEPQSGSTPVWSNLAQLRFAATAAGQSFDLAFRVPIEADYALGMGLTKRNNVGQLRIAIDGTPLSRTDGTPWDGYSFGNGTAYLPLGGAHLAAGQHKITITIVGKNPASQGFHAGVDYLTAVPVNNVTAASFTDAMNNDGIGSDGTGADLGLDPGTSSLSAQTLAAAGYAPGTTATVNGATFTMPTARTDGSDNVIALGQTIPFPAAQQVKATAVGMLVASTCGDSAAATGTITYTDNTTQQSRFPFVEDWAELGTDVATFVLPYRNVGAVAQPEVKPRILALFVPADPTKTLKSITLPNYGTSMLPGSCSPALHVLALALRPVATGWVGTWAAPADTAVPPAGGAGFVNQTLRTVVHPTVTGTSVRVKVANPNATAPVTFSAASLAAQAGIGAATLVAPTPLTFRGTRQVTIPAGGEATSDQVAYPATGGGSGNLIVSLHLPTGVTSAAVHGYPNAPTFLASGDATADTTGTPFSVRLTGSRYVSSVDVSTSDTTLGTVAVLGDQFTAITQPGDGHRATWVDELPAKLATGGVPLPGGLVNASQAGVSPSGHWKLNDGTGTIARDTAGSADATLTGGATWSTDRGGSVTLNGSNGCLITAGRVLVTTASYTVSAWVKLNATGTAAQTVVSHDGNENNAFALQYTGTAENKWAFTLPATSANGATNIRVVSRNPAQPGVWTHVIGTYDAAGQVASLYVNGQLQGTASHTTPWPAAGPLAIGRGKANGSATAFLNGAVSDVDAYQRHANGHDAGILFHGSPVPGDQPGLGALTATQADQTLSHTTLNQPGLRTVIVALGANDLLSGMSKESIELELTELMHHSPTSATGARNSLRTDGTRLHVIVTTVPPLGLADTDPREQRRRQLNVDLLNSFRNYGADEIIDIATAVQDPAHPNQINPAYLTNGAPNHRHHGCTSTDPHARPDAVPVAAATPAGPMRLLWRRAIRRQVRQSTVRGKPRFSR